MRDSNIDFLKAFLIICVIIGHIPWHLFSGFDASDLLVVNTVIYFFHMPLFFVISLLFVPSTFTSLVKRILYIFTIYVFWNFYFHTDQFYNQPIEFVNHIIFGNYDTLNSILWFLPALISMYVLIYIFNNSKDLIKLTLLFISFLSFIFVEKIMSLHINIPFGIDLAIYMLLLFFIIKYCYDNLLTLKVTIPNYVVLIILLSIIIISSIIIYNVEELKTHTIFTQRIDLAQLNVPTTVIGYISYLVLNTSIFLFFMKIKVSKSISYIGRYVLPIYLIHVFVLLEIPTYFESNGIIMVMITVISAVLLPILISKLLMNIKIFRFIGMIK